ncbi:MAG: ATP-binding protein [Rhodospirillales bacterium]|nr:ATP-binding protein [Rhodospirillales bacterium]MBC6440090.1 ATP-binding protein [Rhodospirillales bacterium]
MNADAVGTLMIIEDRGVGMTAEELETAFEPFVQFGSAGRTRKGTGLGLPLTKQLVELHGGSLTLESTAGEGTRAAVRFPANRVVA